jgi:hypothetical protein
MKWKLYFDPTSGTGELTQYVEKYHLMTSEEWDGITESAREHKVSLWIDTDAERKEDHYVCIAFHRTILYIEDLHTSSPETFAEAMQCARWTWETDHRPQRCATASKVKQLFYPRHVTRTKLMVGTIPIEKKEKSILERSALGERKQAAWYNDNIINAWFLLMQQETTDVLCLNSFVILSTRRTLNKHHIAKLKQSAADRKCIACPINLPGHWVLAVYTIATHSWMLYDSLRRTHIDAEVEANLRDLQHDLFGEEDFNFSTCAVCAQQDDASSCGPFVCWYLERFIRQKSMATVSIQAFRKRVKNVFFSL